MYDPSEAATATMNCPATGSVESDKVTLPVAIALAEAASIEIVSAKMVAAKNPLRERVREVLCHRSHERAS